jgi:hypothetical protein
MGVLLHSRSLIPRGAAVRRIAPRGFGPENIPIHGAHYHQPPGQDATTQCGFPGSIISGPTLPESVEVLAVMPMGQSMKIIGRGGRRARRMIRC